MALALAQQNTPFEPHDIVLLPTNGRMNLFVLIKRAALDPVLTELVAEGRYLKRLGVHIGGGIQWIPERALEDFHPVFRRLRRRRYRLGMLSLTVLLTVIATYGHVFYRYGAAESELSAEVEAKTEQAMTVRKQLDQQNRSAAYLDAVRKGKKDAVPVVQVWEELTRRLPDDVWLTDLAIDGQTIGITGFARASAGLISDLGGSPLFTDAAFTAPVVRVPGELGERFELQARVRQP